MLSLGERSIFGGFRSSIRPSVRQPSAGRNTTRVSSLGSRSTRTAQSSATPESDSPSAHALRPGVRSHRHNFSVHVAKQTDDDHHGDALDHRAFHRSR